MYGQLDWCIFRFINKGTGACRRTWRLFINSPGLHANCFDVRKKISRFVHVFLS